MLGWEAGAKMCGILRVLTFGFRGRTLAWFCGSLTTGRGGALPFWGALSSSSCPSKARGCFPQVGRDGGDESLLPISFPSATFPRPYTARCLQQTQMPSRLPPGCRPSPPPLACWSPLSTSLSPTVSRQLRGATCCLKLQALT